MILRLDPGDVRDLLIACLRQNAAVLPAAIETAPVSLPETDLAEPEKSIPAESEPQPLETEAAPKAAESPEADRPEPAPPAAAHPYRERTEQAVSALCTEARGEGMILMGLRAHLDPYFIVRTYAEVLGCSDRDARTAFQTYIKKHPDQQTKP